MLKAVGEGAKKTQIMYRSNLSHKLLSKYLSELVGAGLVVFEARQRCYLPTTKGRNFLEEYREYVRSHKRVEKQLNDVKVKRKFLEDLCSNSFGDRASKKSRRALLTFGSEKC